MEQDYFEKAAELKDHFFALTVGCDIWKVEKLWREFSNDYGKEWVRPTEARVKKVFGKVKKTKGNWKCKTCQFEGCSLPSSTSLKIGKKQFCAQHFQIVKYGGESNI